MTLSRSQAVRVRRYQVVRIINDRRERWFVVSRSLRDDDTWDVIDSFATRDDAIAYRTDVIVRQARIMAEA